jgi:hypothetical protein
MGKYIKSDEERQALEGSLMHWREARINPLVYRCMNGNVCPLCEIQQLHDECGSCPIARFTGIEQCGKSPWFQAMQAHRLCWDLMTSGQPSKHAYNLWYKHATLMISFMENIVVADAEQED